MSQILVTGEAKVRDIQGPVVANSGVITALDGAASQYVRGDGTLADFPTSTGGGSSVSYYLNSSVSQGTIGGVAYRQLSKTPISGAGTDITASTNGYIASYLTDANDPALLEVPAGNFNCEFYFSVNSNNHNPYVYAELYKYNGTTFTLLGTSQSIPEYLTNGTTLSAYYFAIPVAVAALTITDRLAIRIYANVDTRTVTLHTENNHLCQVVTTFSNGLTSLNNLTRQVQFLATGTSGTDFNISSSTATHTFNLPSASATNRGLITTGSQTIAGNKTFTGENYFSLVNMFDQSINYKTDAVLVGVSGYISQAYAKSGSGASSILSMKIADGSSVKNISLDFIGSAVSTPYSYLFPALSGTMALLEGTQTFTGLKRFDLGLLLIEGATPSAVGYTGLTGDANGLVITKRVGSTGYTNLLSFTSATSNTYAFPAASGTIALTSNLSAYLPLTGGTLTGGLIGTTANFTQTLATITAGSSLDATITYTPSTNITSANSYNFISRYKLNLASGTYNSTFGQENATAIFAFTVINGNNGSISTQPIRGVTAGFAVDSAAIKLADYRGFQVSSFDSSIAGNTITNAYGLYIAQLKGSSNFTVTNGYGIYQAGTTDTNFFAGATTFNSSVSVGALSGTSATFSGAVNSDGRFGATTNQTSPSDGSAYFYKSSAGAVLSGFQFIAETGGAGSRGTRLTIDNTGAATFSSSVTAGSFIQTNGNGTYLRASNYTWMGGSGGDYGSVGYNQGYTATTTTYNYVFSDFASMLRFDAGGFNFLTAPNGTAGNAITFTPRMTISSGGDIGIGAASITNIRLYIQGATNNSSTQAINVSNSTGTNLFYARNDGYLYSIGAWSGSDRRLKENITDLDNGLEKVLNLKARKFDLIDGLKNNFGFIAQELQEVIPHAVSVFDEKDEMLAIRMDYIIPHLVKAIQEQTQIIKDLEARIVSLESK